MTCKTRNALVATAAGLALLTASVVLDAQAQGPSRLPVRFLEAILATSGNWSILLPAEAAQRISDLVDWPVGAGVRAVVGTASGRIRVDLQVQESPGDALAFFTQAFEARGWRRWSPRTPRQSGFQSAPQAGPVVQESGRFCGPEDGEVYVRALDREGLTIVRIEEREGATPSWCAQLSAAERAERPRLSERLPVPMNPQEAVSRGGGMRSSGNGVGASTSTSVQLTSELTLFELLIHCGDQLAAAGWQRDGEWLNDVSGGQIWRFTFDDGIRVVGRQAVTSVQPGVADVEFQMVNASS